MLIAAGELCGQKIGVNRSQYTAPSAVLTALPGDASTDVEVLFSAFRLKAEATRP